MCLEGQTDSETCEWEGGVGWQVWKVMGKDGRGSGSDGGRGAGHVVGVRVGEDT
jgi:hypothetical protein